MSADTPDPVRTDAGVGFRLALVCDSTKDAIRVRMVPRNPKPAHADTTGAAS